MFFRCSRTITAQSCRRVTRPVSQRHFLPYTKTFEMDYSSIPTPERCYADFCLVPVGTGELSVAKEVAEVQKLLNASGLTCTMHSAGTTVEGSWDEVFKVIGQAHSLVHRLGVVRIQTSMRVGTRTDKKQSAADKVKRVEDLLSVAKQD